jgi:hypothetical protein
MEDEKIFKLAFYALWKVCNSYNTYTDVEPEVYIEFRVGQESVCVGLTVEEYDAITKACELLDMPYQEVEDDRGY